MPLAFLVDEDDLKVSNERETRTEKARGQRGAKKEDGRVNDTSTSLIDFREYRLTYCFKERSSRTQSG